MKSPEKELRHMLKAHADRDPIRLLALALPTQTNLMLIMAMRLLRVVAQRLHIWKKGTFLAFRRVAGLSAASR